MYISSKKNYLIKVPPFISQKLCINFCKMDALLESLYCGCVNWSSLLELSYLNHLQSSEPLYLVVFEAPQSSRIGNMLGLWSSHVIDMLFFILLSITNGMAFAEVCSWLLSVKTWGSCLLVQWANIGGLY